MRKYCLISLLLPLVSASALWAGNPSRTEKIPRTEKLPWEENRLRKVNLTLEWGMALGFYGSETVAFITEEHSLANFERTRGLTHLNGEVLAGVNTAVNKHWQVGLYSGYTGLCKAVKAFPLEFRASYYRNAGMATGHFVYAGVGCAFYESHDYSGLPMLGRLGYGYRVGLGSATALDFKLSARIVWCEHPVYDPIEKHYVPDERVRQSDFFGANVGVSIGIVF